MYPLAVASGLASAAIYVKAKRIHVRINELLEIERAYYMYLEKEKHLKF
jgi:hypothetical protein